MTTFGFFLSTQEFSPAEILEQARLAEEAGFDAGFDEIYVANMGAHDDDTIRAYGTDVLPVLRR